MSSDAMSSDASSSSVDSSVTGEARVIEVSVSDWEFAPNAITVKKGEKVVLRLKNTDGTHSFLSADLGINVPISEGETKDVTIPTDTAGTFSFRCGVPCGPGHMDMKGTIVVE
jgi:cytochrome c oxidase subunit 2